VRPGFSQTNDHEHVHDHTNDHVDVHVLVDVVGFSSRAQATFANLGAKRRKKDRAKPSSE
jgi:hypothetical protein